LRSEIYRVAANSQTRSNNNYSAIALTNKINKLTNVTINSSTINSSSFSGTTGSFSGAISGKTGSFSSTLDVTGALTGSTGSFSGNLSTAGQLTVTGTATSTVAGDTAFDTNTLYIDSINNRVGIGTTSPAYTLDVNGNIHATGLLVAAGQTIGGDFL